MKGQKSGGRKAGTPNKATADIKGLAQAYTVEALGVLVELMRDETGVPQVRAHAASAIIDRGHGKPAQAITGGDGGPVAVQTTIIHEHHDSH